MNKTFPLHQSFISVKPYWRVAEMTSKGGDVHADFLVWWKAFFETRGESRMWGEAQLQGNKWHPDQISQALKAYFPQNVFAQILSVSSWGIPAVYDISHRPIFSPDWNCSVKRWFKVYGVIVTLLYVREQWNEWGFIVWVPHFKIGITLNHIAQS